MTKGTVLVTGASGRTGALCVKLLQEQGWSVRAMVRSAEKGEALKGPNTEIVVGNVADPQSVAAAMQGVDYVILASSAAPQMKPGGQGPQDMFYPEDATPAIVDEQGGKNIVDAAKAAGVKHVVVISSMGVTQPGHYLNRLGNGNILIHKLAAEDYLRASGLSYTIIRPGGLVDTLTHQNELVVMTGDPADVRGAISRLNVAKVTVAALTSPNAKNKTFELISKEGPETTDYDALFARV
ncbi:MAG: SDR family oxidoreductase [Dehalococcoidia bacterium]|nr:SDR family oxidoreductase [Dehalococcoidia bacterium]